MASRLLDAISSRVRQAYAAWKKVVVSQERKTSWISSVGRWSILVPEEQVLGHQEANGKGDERNSGHREVIYM